MIASLFSVIAGFIIYIISTFGYFGVFICMAIESACIPLPSEIIIPFSGFLAYTGRFNILLITIFGALGDLTGAILAYCAGYYGGRSLVEKYGKYLLISKKDMELSDKSFIIFGDIMIFFSRMLPVVRTYISFPAGVSKMRFAHFCVYTFTGSLIWCFLLSIAGLKLGENWTLIRMYFEKFDILILILLILLIACWLRRHFSVKDI